MYYTPYSHLHAIMDLQVQVRPRFAEAPFPMSPTIHRERGCRFAFYSREEDRMHVHVYVQGAEAKFWLEPEIDVAYSYGLSPKQLRQAADIVKEHRDDFIRAWRQHPLA